MCSINISIKEDIIDFKNNEYFKHFNSFLLQNGVKNTEKISKIFVTRGFVYFMLDENSIANIALKTNHYINHEYETMKSLIHQFKENDNLDINGSVGGGYITFEDKNVDKLYATLNNYGFLELEAKLLDNIKISEKFEETDYYHFICTLIEMKSCFPKMRDEISHLELNVLNEVYGMLRKNFAIFFTQILIEEAVSLNTSPREAIKMIGMEFILEEIIRRLFNE